MNAAQSESLNRLLAGLPALLPMLEATYQDIHTVPVAHACGHDMRVAWLMGASALFARTREAMVAAAMAWNVM